MFVRFVVPSLGRQRWGLTGIIRATLDLKDARRLTYDEEACFDEIYNWFNECLPVPWRFSRSRRSGAASNAICWFKPDATTCIRKARILASLLENYGLFTELIRTRKPGYIVYEDWLQVAAEPFHDTSK
jgi:hypothetical protein